jgi:hypothetical protein
MTDVIRIKRRSTGSPGAPAALASAELAFNELDNTLYYGAGNSAGQATNIITIGGPGAYLPRSGGTMTGPITLAADPAAALQPVTLQYYNAHLPTGTLPTPGPNGSVLGSNGTTAAWTRDLTNLNTVVINSGTVALPPLTGGLASGAILRMGPDNAGNFWGQIIDGFGGSTPGIVFRTAGGTATAPSSMPAGGVLGAIVCVGHGTTSYGGTSASIQMVTGEAWTDSAQGTRIQFSTNTSGTTGPINRMTIGQGVMIGTTTADPGVGRLVLNANSAPLPAAVPDPFRLRVSGADGEYTAMLIEGWQGTATDSGVGIDFRFSHGTAAAPTATQSGDWLGWFSWGGYGATAYADWTAWVAGIATETYSATVHGSGIQFATTTRGTTGAVRRMQIGEGISIGTTTDPGANNLSVQGTLTVGTTTTGGGNIASFNAPTTQDCYLYFNGARGWLVGPQATGGSAGRFLIYDVTAARYDLIFGTDGGATFGNWIQVPNGIWINSLSTTGTALNLIAIDSNNNMLVGWNVPGSIVLGGSSQNVQIGYRLRVQADGSNYFWITGTNLSPETGSIGVTLSGGQPTAITLVQPTTCSAALTVNGSIYQASNTSHFFRNSANTGWITGIGIDTSNNLGIGWWNPPSGQVYIGSGVQTNFGGAINVSSSVYAGTYVQANTYMTSAQGAYFNGNYPGQGYGLIAQNPVQFRSNLRVEGNMSLNGWFYNPGGSDPLGVYADQGYYARARYNVAGVRTWSCGCDTNGWFAIADETAGAYRLWIDTGGGLHWVSDQWFIAGSIQMIAINANANVWIGGNASSITLYAPTTCNSTISTVGANAGYYLADRAGTAPTQWVFYAYGGSLNVYENADGDRFRFNHYAFYPAGDNSFYCGAQGGNVWAAVYSYNFVTQSDLRHKTDIEDLPDCLAVLHVLKPKRFRFNNARPEDDVTHWGFVAQDVGAALAGHDFGGHRVDNSGEESISYNELTAVLWKACQEMSAQNAALEARVAALEMRVQ